jgi:molecular chaperone DnaJ
MTELAIWRILDLRPTDDRRAIKRAYRVQARLLHPDVNPGKDAQERFANLQTAYEQALEWAAGQRPKSLTIDDVFAPEPPASAPAADPFAAPAPTQQRVPQFDEQLDSLFGNARPDRGADVNQSLQLSLREALTGTERQVIVRYMAPCETCHGRGKIQQPCTICSGTGKAAGGTCWNCGGSGSMGSASCSACAASGEREHVERVQLQIAPGTRQGTLLRLAGHGHMGRRTRGDLVARIAVQADPEWSLGPGGSLTRELHIDVATAGLGGVREIEMPDGGSYELTIPPMAGDRREIVIPGRGWPGPDGTGDARVRLRLGFPSEMTQKMRDALQAFRDAAEAGD